jgi:hypothetical protein
MPFIRQLCSEKVHTFKGFDGKMPPVQYVHNQMTVLGTTVAPVDAAMEEVLFYRYGDEALYRVNFICEYVFNRSGYDAVKPAIIKAPAVAAGSTGQ